MHSATIRFIIIIIIIIITCTKEAAYGGDSELVRT